MASIRTLKNRTLTIDPGIAHCGYAYWNPVSKTVTYGTVETLPHTPLGTRISIIIGTLVQATAYQYSTDVDVVVEDFVGTLGKKTTLLIGAIIGEYPQLRRVHPRRWVRDLWGTHPKGAVASDFYKGKAAMLSKREKTHCASQHEMDAFALLYWKSLNLEGSYE